MKKKVWTENREDVLCSFLTGKPAVVVGIAVISIKLRGNRDGVPNQQEDEAQLCHFSTWERFVEGHLQGGGGSTLDQPHSSVTFQKTAPTSKLEVEKQFFLPLLLHTLTSIRRVQPSVYRSPNPSSSPPLLPLMLTLYPTPFKLRSPLFPAHFIALPPSSHPSCVFFSLPVYLSPVFPG